MRKMRTGLLLLLPFLAGTAMAQTAGFTPAPTRVPGGVTPGTSFSPTQRAEIVAIVREALRTDPSILRDAVTALQADEGSRHEAAARAAVGAARPQLTGQSTDPSSPATPPGM